MIDVDFKTHPQLYNDYEECLKFLETVKEEDFEYPEEKVNFHFYTEIKNPKQLMVIKSFLATQNLEKCNLILWSDYDIQDNPLIQPYKEYIDFRVWDPVSEAIGTPLENHLHILLAKDEKHYLQSDLLRILALHKYGGIWADMDIIFLRDFKPLMGQEYMYMWGSETDFANQGACATVLSLNKGSELSLELINEVKGAPPRPATTCWGRDIFATLFRRYKYNILPGTFFNTEWCINKKYPGLGTEIEKSWFRTNPSLAQDSSYGSEDSYLFKQAFTWHWHNDSAKNELPTPGSKFFLLSEWIDDILKHKFNFKE